MTYCLKQKMIIPYSDITNIEFVKPHTVYVDVNKCSIATS